MSQQIEKSYLFPLIEACGPYLTYSRHRGSQGRCAVQYLSRVLQNI